MKFDNLESKIRKELNERLINPNENSWDRLDAMLSLAEEKKPKKNYKWLFVAASIAGGLFVISVFIKNEPKQNEMNNTVVTEQNNTQKPIDTNKEKVKKLQPNKIELKRTYLASEKTISKVKKEPKNKDEKLVETTIGTTKKLNPNKENYLTINTIVTEENIDQLLASVQISTAKNIDPPTINVNAKNLLEQVNEPTPLTFKDKAIITIAENYKNVQMAIANRNQ